MDDLDNLIQLCDNIEDSKNNSSNEFDDAIFNLLKEVNISDVKNKKCTSCNSDNLYNDNEEGFIICVDCRNLSLRPGSISGSGTLHEQYPSWMSFG